LLPTLVTLLTLFTTITGVGAEIAIPYLSEENASFWLKAAEEWQLEAAAKEGDVSHLTGPTGAVVSFRTIERTSDSIFLLMGESRPDIVRNYPDAWYGPPKE